MQSSFLGCRWKDNLKNERIQIKFSHSRKCCLQLWRKKKLNQRSSGDYKAGILHDGSSIEAGEASIIPPVDAIWKR